MDTKDENEPIIGGLPLPVRHALRKLGHDLRDARRRRRIPVAIAAQRASISRTTLVKIEKGDPGVALGHLRHRPLCDGHGRATRGPRRPEERRRRASARRGAPAATDSRDAEAKAHDRRVMDKEALVYVDLDGVPTWWGGCGPARARTRKAPPSNTTRAWLEHPARFSLEPALKLGPGPFHTPADTPMFGAIGDSAPDRWGRTLMRRMERRRAEREGRAPRTLQEIDYLLLVDDEARQGALRFAEREGGPFLREEGVKRIPPLIELPKTAFGGGTRHRGQGHRRRFAPAVCAGLLARRRPAEGVGQGEGRPPRDCEVSAPG